MSSKLGTAIAVGLGGLAGGTLAAIAVQQVAPRAKLLRNIAGVVGAAVGSVAAEAVFPYTPPAAPQVGP